jgi:hypothetical protein
MPTMKRRVIYLSDEDWAKVQEEGRRREGTISSVIRALIVEDEVRREAYSAKHSGPITIAPDFNRRPFTPVPKHR